MNFNLTHFLAPKVWFQQSYDFNQKLMLALHLILIVTCSPSTPMNWHHFKKCCEVITGGGNDRAGGWYCFQGFDYFFNQRFMSTKTFWKKKTSNVFKTLNRKISDFHQEKVGSPSATKNKTNVRLTIKVWFFRKQTVVCHPEETKEALQKSVPDITTELADLTDHSPNVFFSNNFHDLSEFAEVRETKNILHLLSISKFILEKDGSFLVKIICTNARYHPAESICYWCVFLQVWSYLYEAAKKFWG